MKSSLFLAMAALSLAACAPKPAANTAQNAGINATADCSAGGQGPGSPGYQDCVNALSGVNSAALNADADQMRAQIRAQMDQQRAQMNQAMQSAQNSTAGCTTTRDANNNVSTQCP